MALGPYSIQFVDCPTGSPVCQWALALLPHIDPSLPSIHWKPIGKRRYINNWFIICVYNWYRSALLVKSICLYGQVHLPCRANGRIPLCSVILGLVITADSHQPIIFQLRQCSAYLLGCHVGEKFFKSGDAIIRPPKAIMTMLAVGSILFSPP